jgi:UDP-N-acetylmuramate dehydrogenase
MRVNDLIEFQHKNNLDLFLDFDIKKLNWFNIGGKVKIFFKPKNLIELKKFLKIYSNRGKIFVLGSGSNVLFKDNTYDGAVIKLSKSFSKLSRLKEDIIIAGSSCSQKKLSEFAMENQISGFEFMYCIPGSVGGGLKMNSGCFGTEFKDNLVSIQCMDFSGNIKLIPSNKLIFDYRNIKLEENLIFLSATFKVVVLLRIQLIKLQKKHGNSLKCQYQMKFVLEMPVFQKSIQTSLLIKKMQLLMICYL